MAIKDDTSSKGWELDDAGNVGDRWVLEESEQQLADEWDLEGTPEPVGQWHPVEYEKRRRGGPAWILPTIVTVALLAVLGFSAYTLLPQLADTIRGGAGSLLPPFGSNEQAPNNPAVGGVVAQEAGTTTPTVEEPAATPITTEEPTSTLLPTPTLMPTLALPQHLFATVLSEYGVNLRGTPSIDSEIKEILDRDTTYVVLGKPNQEWLQLFISDGPLEPGTPISGYVGYASSEFFAEGMQPMSNEVWDAVLAAVGIEPTATPAPPTPTSDAPPVEVALPTVTPVPGNTDDAAADAATDAETPESDEPQSDDVEETVAEEASAEETPEASITAETTEEPAVEGAADEAATDEATTTDGESTADEEAATLEAAATDTETAAESDAAAEAETDAETVTGTETDGETADETGAVVDEAEADPDTADEEVADSEATVEATGSAAWVTGDAAAAVSATAEPIGAATDTATDTAEDVVAAEVDILVDAVAGVNVRTKPELDSDVVTLLADQSEAPAIGRFANDEWVLIDLGNGATGWIYTELIDMNGEMDSLPVITISDLPTPSPTPTATPELEIAEATEPVEPPAPYSNQLPDGVPGAVIYSAAGVNARSEPVVGANVITIVPENAALPVTARTGDDEWLQVELPQGGLAWVFRATILPRGNVNAVQIAAGAVPVTTIEASQSTVEFTESTAEAPTSGAAADQTEEENTGTASASMRQVVVPVFATPSTDGERIAQYARNTVLTVTGQSGDGLWIQVFTSDGQTGWVASKSVVLSADAATVPIIG